MSLAEGYADPTPLFAKPDLSWISLLLEQTTLDVLLSQFATKGKDNTLKCKTFPLLDYFLACNRPKKVLKTTQPTLNTSLCICHFPNKIKVYEAFGGCEGRKSTISGRIMCVIITAILHRCVVTHTIYPGTPYIVFNYTVIQLHVRSH